MTKLNGSPISQQIVSRMMRLKKSNATSDIFEPCLTLVMKHLILKRAAHDGITETLLSSNGYADPELTGNLTNQGENARKPDWTGIHPIIAKKTAKRLNAVGGLLVVDASKATKRPSFPNITSADVASVKQHSWTNFVSELKAQTEDPNVAVDERLEHILNVMKEDGWKNAPECKQHIQRRWNVSDHVQTKRDFTALALVKWQTAREAAPSVTGGGGGGPL